MNQELVKVYGLIGVLAILIVNVYNTAFKGGKFTCNKYILNTYLYILLALVVISLENIMLDNKNVSIETIFGPFRGWVGVILLFVVSLGLLLTLMSVNPKNVVLKHILWLAFVLFLGILVYPSYVGTLENNTFVATLFSTIGILVFFTIIAFVKPNWIQLSWGPVLTFLILAGIITELCFYFFGKKENRRGRSKGFAYFFIALFTIFILYDTKKIQIAAKMCKESNVDYINQSLGIVLDGINIFQNLAIVNE
tara:strand:+ start:1814 stop:2569 length:756 start_codon:yes stop_codon:yes gene_type:complete